MTTITLPISPLSSSNSFLQLMGDVNLIKTLAADARYYVANSTFQDLINNVDGSFVLTSGSVMDGPLALDFNGAVKLRLESNTAIESSILLNLEGSGNPDFKLTNDDNFKILKGNDGNTFDSNYLTILGANGNIGISEPAPTNKLSVNGSIQIVSGGLKFPDSSIQTTAVSGSSFLSLTGGTIAGSLTVNGLISTINVTANNFTGNTTGIHTGNVTGDVTGNVTGDLTGNVTGDITGAVTGNVTGNVTGDVTGNVTGDLTGSVTGNVTGNVTGDVTGDLKSSNGTKVIDNGTDGTDAKYEGLFWSYGGNKYNTETGTTYTLVRDDAGITKRINNGSGTTITVPTNATVAFPIGTYINFVQEGAGQITFSAAGGVTLNHTDSHTKSKSRYAIVTLYKLDTDVWILGGSTAA